MLQTKELVWLPISPRVCPVSVAVIAAWLMNSGRRPSRTHPVHLMLVTPQTQQLQSHFVKATAHLHIQSTTTQSTFSILPDIHQEGDEGTWAHYGAINQHSALFPQYPTPPRTPGYFVSCTEFTGASKNKPLYDDFPSVWPRVMVFKQWHARSYWNQQRVW